MANLSDAKRKEIWSQYMQDASIVWEIIPIGKTDLRAVVNAIDQWIENNASSFNNAIPEPGKSALTKKQKYRIFKEIIKRKWEVE